MNKKNRTSEPQKQVEFRLTSWPKNRSKYMALITIRQCKGPVSLSFLCIYTPISVKGLRRGLPQWCRWNYLQELVPGRFSITIKGVAFIAKLHSIAPKAVKQWNKELELWRAIPKDNIKDANGALLPQRKIIRLTEAMKYHRKGSPRPRAGRPITEKGRQRFLAEAKKKKELEQLIQKQRQAAEIEQLKSRLKCPRCKGNVTPWGIEDGCYTWACFNCAITFKTRKSSSTQE